MSTATVLQIEKDPRFPIGKFRRSEADLSNHAASIATLAALPENLRSAVSGLSGKQLDTPYRDGGWTVRQLVHHVADSHMNAYVRVRLALTEDWPVVKAYDESQWQHGYTHSENGRQSLAEAVALYDWHCRHHVAHIVELRKRMNW
jgi:hypothetical protein